MHGGHARLQEIHLGLALGGQEPPWFLVAAGLGRTVGKQSRARQVAQVTLGVKPLRGGMAQQALFQVKQRTLIMLQASEVEPCFERTGLAHRR